MTDFTYDLVTLDEMRLGLVVLQADESLERDLRQLVPPGINLLVSRVPSATEVSQETLARMAHDLPAAASLLPQMHPYAAVGYGCTSGAAVIGRDKVADLIRSTTPTQNVTDPVTALIAATAALGINRLAILSPYVAEVSAHLRRVLEHNGVATPVFGSFNEAEEQRVVRIAPASIIAAVVKLAAKGGVDGIFLSCTNLRTLDLIAPLEARLGLPVLSSNQVIGWHMLRLAGVTEPLEGFGRLLRH
ncbi:maleate cis-trans isomerase family protein [Thalassococcus sp. BH17M4-6]|uniref:maleate cis-trans isomerase family protein n=1 Tax=Thalassococcus sp. BH17M4-6 TaxID=3413148 RepID=UPI003BDC11D6